MTKDTQQHVDDCLQVVKEKRRAVKEANSELGTSIHEACEAREANGFIKKAKAGVEDTVTALVNLAKDTSVPNINHWDTISKGKQEGDTWAEEALHSKITKGTIVHELVTDRSDEVDTAVKQGVVVGKEVIGKDRTVNAVMNQYRKKLDISTRMTKSERDIKELKRVNKEILARLDYHEKVIPQLKDGQTLKDLATEMLTEGESVYKIHKRLGDGISYSSINRLSNELKAVKYERKD